MVGRYTLKKQTTKKRTLITGVCAFIVTMIGFIIMTTGSHAAQHDNVGVPSSDCINCHADDIVVEHVDTRGFTCATCHDSIASNVVSAINTGISGTFVSCYDCHEINNHHIIAEAQTGNCTFCHVDQRPGIDPNAPTGQLACRQCHINSSGYVQTSALAPSHSFNTSGNIQDFGACFACHAPVPYHAKPISRPSDCTVSTTIAPGKGSFNLFYSEYGGGSRSNRRNRSCQSQEANYNGPNISFSMVSIVDYMHSNSPYSVPTFGSTGSGTLPKPDIYLDPGNINFGSVLVSDSFSQDSVIRNLGNSVLTISDITTGAGTSAEFTFAGLTLPSIIPVGGSRTITVSYTPANTGTDNGNLVINSNDPDESAVTLSFSGTGEALSVPDINLNPTDRNFGSVLVGDSYSQTTVIQNLGTASLTINSIAPAAGTSNEFSFSAPGTPFTIPAGSSQIVNITYQPGDTGTDTGSLIISSNDPDESSVTVSISGTGETTPNPDINISTVSLNYGKVIIDRTSARTVSIQNPGTADLTINAIERCPETSSDFTWTQNVPITILPKAELSITVSYTPSGEGIDSGCISIASNDPDESNVTLGLEGSGAAQKQSILQFLPAILTATKVGLQQRSRDAEGK